MYVGILYSLVIAVFVVAVPQFALADASLSIVPNKGTYKPGELFSVIVELASGGTSINAVTADIRFDKNLFEVTNISYSRSIFSLWTQEPKYSNANGLISFSGGTPSPGFSGSNGTILRLTFKTRAAGEGDIRFETASIFANDGKGTNVASALNGGTFRVAGNATAAPTVLSTPAEVKQSDSTERFVEVPVISDWPVELNEGDFLTVRGLALPLSKVRVFVQREFDPIIEGQTFAKADGRFNFQFGEQVRPGFYRVWAKNVVIDSGLESTQSDVVLVEVIRPTYLRLGAQAISYITIIFALIGLIILLLLLFFFSWVRVRKYRERQGVEISEAERTVHNIFDTLKEGLSAYLTYLSASNSRKSIKNKGAKTKKELEQELDKMEGDIKKEIKDIGRKED